MKIIKENNIERMKKCDGCGSIFAYNSKDINYYLYPTVRCPVCNKPLSVLYLDKKI